MEQVLSQSEVNALLNAVSEGRLNPDEGTVKEADYEPYDLASQDKIIRGRMPGLEITNERLTRYLQIALTSLIRKPVDVQLEFSGLMKFGEFVNQLVGPTSLNIFRMSPLRGVAILSLENAFIFSMISTFFGGSAGEDKSVSALEHRDFTTIENNIVRKVVRTVLNELQRAWHPVYEIKTQFLRTETNPQFIGAVPSADVVINTQYTVEFENAVGMMNLVIPYSMIEPIKQELSISSQNEEQELDYHWIRRLKEEMLKAEVNLLAELGRSTLTVKELRALSVGDVLLLDTNASDPLVLKIEGVPKMRGVPIVHKGHIALQISKVGLDDEPKASL